MKLNYCEPSVCEKKEKCNRYTVKNSKFYSADEKFGEDLYDICKGERLFLPGNEYLNFKSKEYYIELLNFFDNICESDNCSSCKVYKDKPFTQSRIECKKGESFTCNHKEHPTNKVIFGMFTFMKAENEAFEKAGLKFGEVNFTCPICGGEAWAGRYDTPQNIAHNVTVRSHCEKCGYVGMN